VKVRWCIEVINRHRQNDLVGLFLAENTRLQALCHQLFQARTSATVDALITTTVRADYLHVSCARLATQRRVRFRMSVGSGPPSPVNKRLHC
jgi:hypothetical protein